MGAAAVSYTHLDVYKRQDDPRRIQGFVKRVAHVDRIEWLNMAQCEKVIEGLKAILARQRRKEAEL